MVLDLWYVYLVCHQYGVCENYVGSVYGGLTESGLCVFRELYSVRFLVVGFVEVCSMLIVVMMGKWSDDSAC